MTFVKVLLIQLPLNISRETLKNQIEGYEKNIIKKVIECMTVL